MSCHLSPPIRFTPHQHTPPQRVFAAKFEQVQAALTSKQIARLILFVEANRPKIETALKVSRQIRVGHADV